MLITNASQRVAGTTTADPVDSGGGITLLPSPLGATK
jgi:hypothetical protein